MCAERSDARYRKAPMPAKRRDVYVCHAGSCLARGAEGVLTEIEELVKACRLGDPDDAVRVRETGCLGYCSQAPNAAVVDRGSRELNSSDVIRRIDSLEASAKVARRATGVNLRLEDPELKTRCEGLRERRARTRAAEETKWNAALRGLDVSYPLTEDAIVDDHLATCLAKAGYPHGVDSEILTEMPAKIENYSRWTLQSVTPTTRHSAVFRFVTKDLARGTPHPRGNGRRAEPVTWHVTLLAAVGANDEGPLPWIERDYTPVSTAKEWERGTCDLLVKVYTQGAATSWLLREATLGAEFLMSKPAATLHVPGLTPSGKAAPFRPKSMLLMLAGTGVVALPQLLAHRDPVNKLGISTPRRDQMKDTPIDVLLSFREDDVLMLPELTSWCREGAAGPVSSPYGMTHEGVRHCTVLLTPPAVKPSGDPSGDPSGVPFPNHLHGSSTDADNALASLAKFADVRRGRRLDAEIVEAAVARMPPPVRVVVSGPSAFNGAAREYLRELMDVEKHVTILAA